jgi:lipopolysaccharide/colanic/teichoic acid biosynthesis glycosyltransferase
MVRMTSKGPIFFRQERIGKGGHPFLIIKYRSMYTDAEKLGPQLASTHDPRVTPWGRFMRKTRLDEIPQFWNVLVGEMSLVGPRPERQFFIDQIVQVAPHYKHLCRVRPGITSLGQVKFGYASNVEQMVRRLRWDIIYIENMSLLMDFRIVFYTVWTVIMGRGK